LAAGVEAGFPCAGADAGLEIISDVHARLSPAADLHDHIVRGDSGIRVHDVDSLLDPDSDGSAGFKRQ
jgi:hypothetical protein